MFEFFEEVHLIGKFLVEAIFINSQSEIYFTLWAFAYYLLQASLEWYWLAVDGVSAVLRSERYWAIQIIVHLHSHSLGRKTADTPSTASQRQSDEACSKQ